MAAVSARSNPSTPIKSRYAGANGASGLDGGNGYGSPPDSPRSPISPRQPFRGASSGLNQSAVSSGSNRISSLNQLVHRDQMSGSYGTSSVQETAMSLKRKSASELGAGVSQNASNVSFINLVESIRSERLATLPHKGGRWDQVLIRALYFAEQLHGFENAVQSFATGSEAAGQVGYGHARLLLELGHENSEALDKAFGFFYKCALMASSLLDRSDLLSVTGETREQLCMMYSDLLTLVVEVAVRFYKAVHGMSTSSLNIDMYETFGDTIETFRSRHGKIIEAIWSFQIEKEIREADVVGVKVLGRWLAPQDRVLAVIGGDHTTFADQQAEFTCLWFQDDLTSFVKSDDQLLLVNGRPGSGKTTLAASIVERLQRPLGRRSFQTLFCSIGAVPSQATTLHVVKALLYQLLNIRVGNMDLYRSLVESYHHARQCADPKAYEDHLWVALAQALKRPIEDGNDTILIVDGLDELASSSKTSGQDLLNKLAQVTSQAKRVKMIGLSQTLSVPSSTRGSQRLISPEDTRDDLHAVVIRSLIHCRHFHSKPGPEQESLINRIVTASDGSFLVAALLAQTLRLEKTQETFTKAVQNLQNAKPSVQDLVSRLLSMLEPNNDAKTLLSWLVDTARPMTYDELQALFSINIQRVTNTERRVDVHNLVNSIKPLLSVHEDIVRVRHVPVHYALQTLFNQGKVLTPVKD
ncbi:hypothetical protein LTS18_013143, partial [Coniosporium uncinatum]